MRVPVISKTPSSWARTSTASWLRRWPPFRMTQGQSARLRRSVAPRLISSSVWMRRPRRTSASGILGVNTSARGISLVLRTSTASCSRSRCPFLETMTGSTTSMVSLLICRSRQSATISTIAALASMPVLMAVGQMSSSTASSCFPTKSGATGSTAWTPRVF